MPGHPHRRHSPHRLYPGLRPDEIAVPLQGRTPADNRARALFWRGYIAFLVAVLAIIAMVVFLPGCSTYTGDRPPVLINGYDPTLTSHAEALGLKEPRP